MSYNYVKKYYNFLVLSPIQFLLKYVQYIEVIILLFLLFVN